VITANILTPEDQAMLEDVEYPYRQDYTCPFCAADNMDALGMNIHLNFGHCETFASELAYAEERWRRSSEAFAARREARKGDAE
jgi:ribosomal protein L37AE/L43A